ncbi:MAG: 50S ribosomal protein L10 [Candidatus Margulisbacteria bacterium]|jgi:large subunit ribosomal protein L10|nr:50S ribosomal protein L10 [Candidatus Margulisiibacteriota bacterium]
MSEKAIAAKKLIVDELKEKLSRATVLVVSDYQGYSVKQITELRKKLRPENSELKIIKNTLIERAVEESGLSELAPHLKGSTALLLGYQDAVTPLKVLVKFIKDNEKGAIRGGLVDKTVFGEKELTAMSKLPSKEVLIGKVVGGFKSPLYGLVNVLSGSTRKLVYALEAIRKQKGGE